MRRCSDGGAILGCSRNRSELTFRSARRKHHHGFSLGFPTTRVKSLNTCIHVGCHDHMCPWQYHNHHHIPSSEKPMNPSNLTSIRQPHSRSRARRARRSHAAAQLLPDLLLRRPGTYNGPSITQTLERPQQTGILWEPGRLYPPRARRGHGAESQRSRTQPHARPLPLPVADPSFSSEDGDALTDAREARVTEYLTSWDEAWTTASAKPVEAATDDIPDIGGMAISESPTAVAVSPHGATLPAKAVPPREVPVDIDSKSIFELSPSRCPEESDGGVAIPQEEHTETRPHPTTVMQLAELRAKIPWLVEQRTIDGAGWRPLGEYYWAGQGKGVGS